MKRNQPPRPMKGRRPVLLPVLALLALVWLLISNSVAYAYPVPPLPEGNLIVNPWFRSTSNPSEAGFDGWTVLETDGITWNLSQKESNPSPDIVISGRCGFQQVYCGTSARWADQEGVHYPNIDVFAYQVVAADPANRHLKFFTYFVSHQVDVGAVNVYGSQSQDGPWELVWVPLYHSQSQLIKPDGGEIRELWLETGMRERIIAEGYPYYKIELQSRVPELKGDVVKGTGFKITGLFFTALFTDAQAETLPPRDEGSAGPTLTPASGTAGTETDTESAAATPEPPTESSPRGTEVAASEAETVADPTGVAEAPDADALPPMLEAEALSATEILLTWNFGEMPGRLLRLERSPDGVTGWRRVASLEPAALEYVVSGLNPDTVNYFRVRVTQNDSSNVVSVRTLPPAGQTLAPPGALQIVPDMAAQQVELQWQDLSENETGFEIERSADGVNFTLIDSVTQGVTSFIDEAVDEPANYYYRVRTVGDGGYSEYSETVLATLGGNAPDADGINAGAADTGAVDTAVASAGNVASTGSLNWIMIGIVGLIAFLAGMGVILLIVRKQRPGSDI